MLRLSTRSGRTAWARSESPRRRQARALLAFAALLVSTWFAPEAAAQTTFTVDYRAPESCPDRGTFIHEIQRRSRVAVPVGKAEQPKVVLVVELKTNPAKGSATGKLLITEGVKTTERSLKGKTCPEVASALALIAALTVDPNAESSPAPEPLPLPPDPSGPPILTSKPALIEGPAPLLPSFPAPTPRAGKILPTSAEALIALPLPVLPAPEPEQENDLRGGVTLRFFSNVGAAPTAMVGIIGGGEVSDLSHLGWSFRAELSYLSVTAVTAEGTADSDYKLVRGHLRGCVPTLQAAWFRLAPCAAFAGGGVFGRLTQIIEGNEESVSATGPWLDAGLTARASAAPLDWLAFEVEVGPSFPIVYPNFESPIGTTRAALHSTVPVTLDLGLGAAIAF